MKFVALALAVLFSFSPAWAARDGVKAFRHKVYNASLQLYRKQDKNLLGICTTSAFEKTEHGYRFVVAGHCAQDETVDLRGGGHSRKPVPDGQLFIGHGTPGNTHDLIPVSVQWAGDPSKGWDVAILTGDTQVPLTILPLGDDTKLEPGDSLVSVSAPLGGNVRYWFQGYFSAGQPQINPASLQEIPAWNNLVFVQLPSAEGSSGAAVISPDQQAMVGIFVGYERTYSYFSDIISGYMVSSSAIKTFIANPALHTGITNKK